MSRGSGSRRPGQLVAVEDGTYLLSVGVGAPARVTRSLSPSQRQPSVTSAIGAERVKLPLDAEAALRALLAVKPDDTKEGGAFRAKGSSDQQTKSPGVRGFRAHHRVSTAGST